MIIGYAERGSVLYAPSAETLWTVLGEVQDLAPHRVVLDVAVALTTCNVTETVCIAERYGEITFYVEFPGEETVYYGIFEVMGGHSYA